MIAPEAAVLNVCAVELLIGPAPPFTLTVIVELVVLVILISLSRI